jgi:NAD(P)-dependent dehydrogenase (short-subunit alcohol dehydrogenase family)
VTADPGLLVDYGLEGKAVVITGAAGGIGTAIATAFARCGARILAVDQKKDPLDRLLSELGDGHFGLEADLGQSSATALVLDTALTQLHSIDVLVHAAAVIRRLDLHDVTEDDWDLQLDVNLKASFFLCRGAAEQMVRQGTGGRIVTFSSQAWWSGGFGGSVVYAASKGGVVSMTRGLARTYGSSNITVNSISPGLVRTPMMLETSMPEDTLQRLIDETPLRRMAEPEEVADAVLFLASRQASFISGATINISGGLLMY